ncbi:regulator of chromosome condensation 1/beta-lactamase-inhibitor protein II [Filobasidium floriforme]|uniref:regulator of chromosome condensation 1/beta-lactamase-inhibitor protein II n=1 Tax=Filobasidium floriforme TaxID=5210 RepID=UPI001E8D0DC4|nr:regulator of chromosome condensation 1/beta-lactamase-inhibitor protein II [Filobasidium floriforme]KAH8084592.1 regulator of chromosome condensation 1/beta-lactamase-inhibitor protein II [Filobasidium floriforme]
MGRCIQLLASGSNGSGQLGIGHVEDVSTYTYCRFSHCDPDDTGLTRLSRLPGVILAVSSGAGHSLLLAREDEASGGRNDMGITIWTTGTNQYNQLGPAYEGDSTDPSHTLWKRLDYTSYIETAGLPLGETNRYTPKEISCSWSTSIVCFEHSTQNTDGIWSKESDKTISFGTNDFGELGCGAVRGASSSSEQEHDLVRVVQLPQTRRTGERLSVRKIKASHRNIVCLCDWILDADGGMGVVDTVVYGWGAGRHGQLDSGYPSSYPEPIEIGVTSAVANRINLGGPLTVEDLAVGAGHILFCLGTSSGGETIVVGLGSNAKHQLDLNFASNRSGSSQWGDIGCTWNGSFMSEKGPGGEIWSTGTNTHGQLGQGRLADDDQDVAPGLRRVAAMSSDQAPLTVHGIVCGSEHVLTLIQTGDGSDKIWTWGWNEHGNLGLSDDDVQDRWTPVEILLEPSQRPIGAWAGCGTTWLLVETTIDD